jgi:precorrin-6B C5,15-methyltransferase / cobalt-precorrin-6B C5,C15-methyltransferase
MGVLAVHQRDTVTDRLVDPAVTVIGIGDDGIDALPDRLKRRLATADLVCGGERHLTGLSSDRAEQFVIKAPLESVLGRVEEAARNGRNVVVLASGDPCCFGIGPLLVEHLGSDRVEIVPSVSSVQHLFARLGKAWQDIRILSAHGRAIEPVIGPAISSRCSAILTDAVNTPSALARALLDCGMEDCGVAVGERLGGPAERIVEGRLSQILDQAFDPLSTLALIRETNAVRTPRTGLPEAMYQHSGGMITKAEVRAVSISQLALAPGDIVWDIGAGCGSVGLEAASFVENGFVYAIESDPKQADHLRQNLSRFPGPLRIVRGEAPEVLIDLPNPDAVFIGGAGGRLGDILRLVLDRLRPGGRLVANFVVLDHLQACQQMLAEAGWQVRLSQFGVNRLASHHRFEALNPVLILSAGPGVDRAERV